MATYVYASSQGQRTHTTRTNYFWALFLRRTQAMLIIDMMIWYPVRMFLKYFFRIFYILCDKNPFQTLQMRNTDEGHCKLSRIYCSLCGKSSKLFLNDLILKKIQVCMCMARHCQCIKQFTSLPHLILNGKCLLDSFRRIRGIMQRKEQPVIF